MNVFELILFLGLLALVVLGSRLLAYLFGVSVWIFPIPLIGIAVLALRWVGNRWRERRLGNRQQ